MKKKLYDYPSSKIEHDYKVVKILVVIVIICAIVILISSFFAAPNSNNINANSNKGWIGFIQSCAGYALGWIF